MLRSSTSRLAASRRSSTVRSAPTPPSLGTVSESPASSRADSSSRRAAASSAAASANRSRMWPPGTSRLSSSGVPSATMRPPSSTAMRSASPSASSRYWVVSRTVVPSATRPRTMSHIVRRLRGSRPVVGSSRKMTRASRRGSSRGRGGAACRPSRWRAACGRRRRGRTAPAARRPAAFGASPEVAQPGHEQQVLLAGEQVVDRGELAGDADRGADAGRVADDVAADTTPCRRRAGPAWTGCARWWSCRRRSGRAARRRCPRRCRGRCRRARRCRRRTSAARGPRSLACSCVRSLPLDARS